MSFLNNKPLVNKRREEAQVYLNVQTTRHPRKHGRFVFFITLCSNGVFPGSVYFVCVSSGDEPRRPQGRSGKITVCRREGGQQWKQAGEERRKRTNERVLLGFGQPGGSLPYIRTTNEAFSER